MPRRSQNRRKKDNDVEEVVMEQAMEEDSDEEVEMMFSQQAPEMSQPIQPVKASERNNLENMGTDNKEKVIVSLSRLVLFKALAGEPIDRLKCWKEATADSQTNDRISSAVFDEAAVNLRNVFGFELRRIPKWMEDSKTFPKKFKDRHYVINDAAEDDENAAEHARAIHSVHTESAIERGLLMIILALAFCKGQPKPDGSRWITDSDLYRLLHGIDENIPEEPPAAANRKASSAARHRNDGEEGMSQTPHVDSLLEKFVHLDYLMKEKAGEETGPGSQVVDNTFQYAMGPRAAMEIGRKQIVIFCAEVLDEQPDETMLAEIEAVDDEEFTEEDEQ